MTTLQNFGVPVGNGINRVGMLQPKTKHKFRVRVFGFGPVRAGIELTQQVQTVNRPNVQMQPVEVHSYNNVAYYAGKAQWSEFQLSVRDDVTNSVSRLVGYQVQKQMNFFESTTPLAASNYKFDTWIETLDGGNDAILEQWVLEGCFLATVDYQQFDYQTADVMMIDLTVRFDNATQSGGLMPLRPVVGSGSSLTG